MASGDPDAVATMSSLTSRLNWFDTMAAFFGQRDPQAVLDYPIAFTFQMLRADFLARGLDARCVPPLRRPHALRFASVSSLIGLKN